MNEAEFKSIVRGSQQLDQAGIFVSSTSTEQEFRVLTLSATDLATAKLPTAPMEIKFPFKSFVVLAATDSNVTVNARIGTRDTFQDTFPIKRGMKVTLPYPYSSIYLDWAAQSAKTMTILFSVRGEIDTNILDLVNSGGVSISSGSAFTTAVVALVAVTATQLFAAVSGRKTATWVNDTGADVWLGNASVSSSGTNKGVRVGPGSTFQWQNTAALYAYSVAGSATEVVMEES